MITACVSEPSRRHLHSLAPIGTQFLHEDRMSFEWKQEFRGDNTPQGWNRGKEGAERIVEESFLTRLVHIKLHASNFKERLRACRIL